MLLAGEDLLLSQAGLTLHVAAPSYLTVAGEGDQSQGRVIAPATAQTPAATVLRARPSGRPRREPRRPTEAGRLVQEDQIGRLGSGSRVATAATADASPHRPGQLAGPGGGVSDAQDAHGVVVAMLEKLACDVKRRELLPARPHGAGARDAVTLTGRHQSVLYSLRKENK